MCASRQSSVIALACLLSFCLCRSAAAQEPDQVVAERVLGAQWKQLSRRAGTIFAGTVIAAGAETTTSQTVTTQAATPDRVAPGKASALQLTFRVDQAIAGIDRGQILTIHEWAGALSMQRPMRPGQHFLIFLYPPSRLGFTSPVGGSLGQIALDPSGKNISEHEGHKSISPVVLQSELPPRPFVPVVDGKRVNGNVTVVQLERAIRSAREER